MLSIKVCYLTMYSLNDFECYDSLTFIPMGSLGYFVSEVSWQANVDWNDYDYVVIRSPWDYQDHADKFLNVLKIIDASSATLLNPLSIVSWNINKTYLADLQKSNVPIVPTIFSKNLTIDQLESAYTNFDVTEIVVKPTISANADDTFRIPKTELNEFIFRHIEKFQNRECMLQPFVPAIVSEGEYSLFYFDGDLSHCILKTPKSGDFRVQEEHGGRLKLIESPDSRLLISGKQALKAIPETLLYARLDFVRFQGDFVLMEAELIEPSLYFNMDPESPARFAKAFDDYHNDRISNSKHQ